MYYINYFCNIVARIDVRAQKQNVPDGRIENVENIVTVNDLLDLGPFQIPNLEEQEYALWLAHFINW